MTSRRDLVTDSSIEHMLRSRTTTPDPSLLDDVLQQVDVTLQRRRWLPWAPTRVTGRTLLLVAVVAALIVALAGAIGIGSRPPHPLPVSVHFTNGVLVAQGDGCALMAIDPATGRSRPLFAGVPHCFAADSQYQLDWDPSGSRLAFAYSAPCGVCGSNEAKAMFAAHAEGIWVFDPATSTVKQLVQCPPPSPCAEPSWSPDGSQIAFTMTSYGPQPSTVWVVPSAGGAARQLAEGASSYDHPRWAPDSRQLAYVDESSGRPGVIVAETNGTRRSVVFNAPGQTIEDIQWSRDGRSMLVTTNGSVGGAIQMVSVAGSGTWTLLSLTDNSKPQHAQWSPDGLRIAFARVTETTDSQMFVTLTRAEIWTMAFDGGERRLLYQAASPLFLLSAVRWSPDGQFVSFSAPAMGQNQDALYVAAENGSGLRRLRYAGSEGGGLLANAWQPLPAQPLASP